MSCIDIKRARCCCALLILGALCFTSSAFAAQHKGVSISLRARWQGTPFLLEAAEFLADEDQQLFWRYVTSLSHGDTTRGSSECWQSITSQAAAHLTPHVAKILPVVLGVRQYSARLEAFRQLAKQLHPSVAGNSSNTQGSSCCFVDLEGVVFSEAAALRPALEQQLQQRERANSSLQLFDVDHVYGTGRGAPAGAAHAVLYGPPGAECWSEMHAVLAAAADAAPKDLVYAVRPVLLEGCQVHPCAQLGSEQQLVLPGFGVEAVLKNMEYSAVDDKAKAAAKQAKGSGDEPLGTAKGFDFDQLVKRKPHLKQELLTFKDALTATDDGEALKVWDLKDAGLQAATRILDASDPLALLREISQEFPGIVSSLTRQTVAKNLRKEVKSNQQAVGPGGGYLMLNGLLVEINNFELYSFLDRLRTELRLQDQLRGLGLPPPLAGTLLTKRSEDKSHDLQDLRLDLTPMRKVLWVNNLEKDAEYKSFPSNLQALFQMNFGRMPTIARNVFCVVAIADPLSAGGLAAADLTETIQQNMGPLRVGMLPLVPEVTKRLLQEQLNPGVPVPIPAWKDMSQTEQFMRGFLTLKSAFGPKQAFAYWGSVKDPAVTTDQLLSLFEKAWTAASKGGKSTWASPKKAERAAQKKPAEARADLVSGAGFSAEVGMALQDLCRYMLRKGLGSLTRGQVWFNGVMSPLPEGGPAVLEQEVWSSLMYTHMRDLQDKLWHGYISNDEDDVLDALMELMKSVRRWNPRLLAQDQDEVGAAGKLSLVKAASHPGFAHIPYLHTPKSIAKVKAVTHLLVTDLAQPRGRALLTAALEWVIEDEGNEAAAGRLGLVLAPAGEPSVLDALLLLVAEKHGNDTAVLKGLKALATKAGDLATTPASAMTSAQLDAAVELLKDAQLSVKKADLGAQAAQEAAKQVQLLAQLATEVLTVPAGTSAVVSNGRLLVDHTPGGADTDPLVSEDFQLMQLYGGEYQPGVPLAAALRSANSSGTFTASARQLSDVVMMAASSFAVQEYPDARYGAMDQAKHLSAVINAMKGPKVMGGSAAAAADPSAAALHLVAVLDPLTRLSQRTSQVLTWVAPMLDPAISLFLNPVMDMTDMPLKSYYRYALPTFERDAEGRLLMPGDPTAYFPRLPEKRVLTINLETPESWLVEPVMALHDLDNLLLEAVPEQVAFAEYELEAVVLTGSCNEVLANGRRAAPPRGLQLHLGTATKQHMVDTLVMSNLGYFQLKASPGLWQLSIAPGRSRNLYRLLSSSGTRSGQQQLSWWGNEDGSSGSATGLLTDNSTQVLVTSFSGKHMNLRVMKRAGKENMTLLNDAVEKKTDGSSSSSAWSEDEDAAVVKRGAAASNNSDVINVFTVASGHMYERLQKIMILSVIKNTKSRVKFWIIKNYMSPHHKRIMPAMAAQYGFEYEFVTYKWPHWLRKQVDKQRIIWAYKILFLDVLFPLDVPRMIFVDSDQVVRTDLAQLYNMDLKGASLAYTPFCDNNKEMDEFRFWKGGFWLNHLGGKPYHISALYLIDLKRFRQQAAGDQYRITYDNLSRDPNSLANLDQDLPNYLQHQVPIHSLPPEWLWCESWCGNNTKAKAKTIDLCNNPKTKEPKLTAARRIIAEWPALDEEQGNFTAKIDAKFQQQEAAFLQGGAAGDIADVVEGAAQAAQQASSGGSVEGGPGPGLQQHDEL